MLHHRSYGGGILPSDEGRQFDIERRRRAQRDEYQTYLERKKDKFQPSHRSKSIAEIRKEMSLDREREIEKSRRRHEKVIRGDKEGEGLVGWASGRGITDDDEDGSRSYSAPVVPGLGLRIREETQDEKKRRQREYRTELEAQMRERAKLRERNGRHFESYEDSRGQMERRRRATPPGERRRRATPPRDDRYFEARFDEEEEEEGPRPSRYVPGPSYYCDPANFPHPTHIPYYYPPYAPHPPHMGGSYYPPPPPMDPYFDNPYMFKKWRRPRATHPGSPSPEEDEKPQDRKSSLKWREDGGGGGVRRASKDLPPSFQAILEKQAKEKREREKFIKRMEEDVYDPWGRPGGGAPLTDATGNLVTERGLMRKSFDEKTSPRISEEEKKRLQQMKQKEELEKQIKEREERKLSEKLMRQQEDEFEEKRIIEEAERLRLQSLEEREREREKERVKEEKKKVEEPTMTKQEQVEQKLWEELEKKKRKEREEEERLQRLADKMASNAQPYYNSYKQPTPIVRAAMPPRSPPIPTLRNKSATPPVPPALGGTVMEPPPTVVTPPTNTAPPLVPNSFPQTPPNHQIRSGPRQAPPTTNQAPPSHASSSPEVIKMDPPTSSDGHILQNLSMLKDQIRKNIKTSQPLSPPIKLKPSIPKRQQQQDKPTDKPTQESIDTFNSIKYSRPTSSKMSFWRQYPAPPKTRTSLEIQQDALLQHQQDRLQSKSIIHLL